MSSPVDNSTALWQTIWGAIGGVATLLTIVLGPRVANKARQRQKDATKGDIAYYQQLVANLDRGTLERDQTIDYLRSKLSREEQKDRALQSAVTKQKHTISNLRATIERFETEKEEMIRHKQVIERKLPDKGTSAPDLKL